MNLAEESFLTDDFVRQLINVGEVDILVGLPTHNNAKTIGSIVSTIQSGLLRGFPRERAVIINVDAGSRDGTRSRPTATTTRNTASRCGRFWPRRNCSAPKRVC
jgi:hypothetical protein